MSDTKTKTMIDVYNGMADNPLMFLSGFFRSPRSNFYNTETVEIDIQRDSEDVSIVVQDLSTGYRHNSDDLYTNKEFKAPVHKESFSMGSDTLLKRVAGKDPFADKGFRAEIISRFFAKAAKVGNKIRRSVELQASQVLQSGVITLTDINGNALYSLDYQPKATHFPTAGVAWTNTGTADPIGDLTSLMNVIRADGLRNPDMAIFGEDAFENALKIASFKDRFETRRIDLGSINPMEIRGNGGQYRGVVDLGNYRLEIWTYAGKYKDPQTGNTVDFVDPDNVVIMSSATRLDATFGAIPHIGKALGVQTAINIPNLPRRIVSTEQQVDLFTNVWLSPDGEQLFGGVGARPLMIPTAIDTYGCLTTV